MTYTVLLNRNQSGEWEVTWAYEHPIPWIVLDIEADSFPEAVKIALERVLT